MEEPRARRWCLAFLLLLLMLAGLFLWSLERRQHSPDSR